MEGPVLSLSLPVSTMGENSRFEGRRGCGQDVPVKLEASILLLSAVLALRISLILVVPLLCCSLWFSCSHVSGPVSSPWKPVPTSSMEATRPFSPIMPSVGAVTREISFKRVDLPAPLRPMMPMRSPF